MLCSAFRLLAVMGGIGGLLWAVGSNPTALPVAEAAPSYVVSGPYTHDNLSVFLLHGPDTLPARPVKSLDEALAAGTAVVHDDQSVNTLVVENLSDSDDLMMQNGDILKGGRQDRVLRTAMILPPKSGRVVVEVFCVESGRWQQRGTEAATRFAENPGQIAGKALKHAVNTSGVQAEVWKNVAAQQAALTAKVGKVVNGAASPTSLQLALEDKELQAKLAGYRAALAGVLDGKLRPIGFAIAVNGKVTGAEVFGSGVLLAKAWPKALGAAAVEALAEKQDGVPFATATEVAVNAFLADAAKPEEQPNEVARAERRARGGLTRGNEGLEAAQDGAIEVLREASVVLDSARVAENPIGTATAETTFSAVAGVGPYPRDRMIPNSGGQLGRATANPVLRGRSATTRDQMVTGNGGQGQPQDALNLPVLNPSDPSRIAPSERAGVSFNARQFGHRQEIADGRQQAAPAVRAVPVVVNRTAGQNGVMVESRDRANPGVVIHRTFIAK